MCIISVYISIGKVIYSMLHNIIYSTYNSHNIKCRQTISGCGYTICAFIYILIYGLCENNLPCIVCPLAYMLVSMKSWRNRVGPANNDEKYFCGMARDLIG